MASTAAPSQPSAADAAAAAPAKAPVVAPLSLSDVQRRYPHLYRQYSYLSQREMQTHEDIGDMDGIDPPKIDPASGLALTIMGNYPNDFTEPLHDNKGCPMTTASDGNKFCIFLWKCLSASESGSCGGDACRQFDILNAALDDVLRQSLVKPRFEHLLGWTAAAANHGLSMLLYRGDPDRNRSLFKAACDEWKKLFERVENDDASGTKTGVRQELGKFAETQCKYLQEVLKAAKKEYGDYAKYTFNFKKQRRAPKGPSGAAFLAAANATTNSATSAAGNPRCEVVTVTKPSKDALLGINLIQKPGGSDIIVKKVAPDGLFAGSKLEAGMKIETINGKNFSALPECIEYVKSVEGQLVIVASRPTASPAAAAVASAVATAAASTNQKENSVPAKNNFYAADEDDELQPWEMEGWVPMTSSGKQKTPNMIRNQLQKYIDQCKADGTKTQTAIIQKMGVNNNTFRRFMDPKTYKDQWSATQNGTYWAAARLLAEVKYEEDKAKKSGAKRKSGGGDGASGKKAKAGNGLDNNAAVAASSKKMSKAEAEQFIERINAVEGVPEHAVYDTCPQLVKKIKDFLQRDGVTKAALLRALGNINGNSLQRFLTGKKQDQCGNVTYKASYVFFEKLRILEGQKKSAARLKNERENPAGFSLQKSRGGKIYYKFLPF